MEDRFAGIREFVATVDGGSFTAAAVEFGVTGSAVGKSISKLEARLGAQLLHRTTRRIDLTTEGEVYLVSCRRILEELDQSEAYLATGHLQPTGRLRIDLPTTFGRRHILPSLLALGLQHPGLDLSISLRDRAVDMVSEGIDIAVRIGALGDHADLVARCLGEQRLVTCASPAYLQLHGTPVTRRDLAKHDCLIGWRRGNRPTWLFKNEQDETTQYEVKVRHELTDGDALLHACLIGCGIAQMPTWLAGDALRTGTLLPVLSDIAGGAMPINVIWQKTWHMPTKVRVTVDELMRIAVADSTIFGSI